MKIRRFLPKRLTTSATAARARLPRWTVGGLAALSALLVLSACVPVQPSSPPKVILYGDSLSIEAWDAFEATIVDHGIAQAVNRTLGGSGICDFFDDFEADKENVKPVAVVLSFVGNTQPPCMNGLTGQAALDKYRNDAQHAINVWKPRGVQVFLVGTPPRVVNGSTPEMPDANRSMYFQLALDNGIWYIDAGHAVFNHTTGYYQFHMPCFQDEGPELGCVNGLIPVRDPSDGLHFCSAGTRPLPCPGYNSGARRFGFAMAATPVDVMRL